MAAATFRVSCSECGHLATNVTRAAPEVLDLVAAELEAAYQKSHTHDGWGYTITVTRKDHKPRTRKVT